MRSGHQGRRYTWTCPAELDYSNFPHQLNVWTATISLSLCKSRINYVDHARARRTAPKPPTATPEPTDGASFRGRWEAFVVGSREDRARWSAREGSGFVKLVGRLFEGDDAVAAALGQDERS